MVENAPVCLADFEDMARRVLPDGVFTYVRSAAGDEITFKWNREALDRIRLRPKAMIDVSEIDTTVDLFGTQLASPIMLAPVGCLGWVHPEGEIGVARKVRNTVFVISTAASYPLEKIAKSAQSVLWFQLYPQDRGLMQQLVERAQNSGYRAICVTVDTPVLGTRDGQRRSGINLSSIGLPNLGGARMSLAAMTWRDLAWLRGLVKVPLLLKGILNPEDAARACTEGVDGLIVSNHGGRNLDTLPAVADCLPSVVEAVAGRVPIVADGGVRRGTDVLKLLALGARAVMIGRPYVYALAAGGPEGVRQCIDMLVAEFEAAMALTGRVSTRMIDASVLW